MDPISMLIFNALVRRQSITLPDIGSLRVITRAPMIEKKRVLIPPANLVVYANAEFPECTSIITLIALSGNKDEAQAWDDYNSWLATARVDGAIQINSVGEIRDGRFLATTELNEILNPVSPTPMELPRQTGIGQILLWAIGAIVVGGAISIGIITLLDRDTFPDDKKQMTVTEAPATFDSSAQEQDAAIGEDAPIDNPTAGSGDGVAAETAPTPSANSVVATGQWGYYVVIGSYSTDENANKFIGQAKETDPTLTYYKLPLGGGKTMVYTSLSASAQEAERLKNQCSTSFPDAWVFKRKVQ